MSARRFKVISNPKSSSFKMLGFWINLGRRIMKKTKFSDERIAYFADILRQAEGGVRATKVYP
jgi:hypothetical protein